MRHLFNVRAEVLQVSGTLTDGTPEYTWAKAAYVVDPLLGVPGEVRCRLDLTFTRQGKDQPMPVVAGRAPDRVGVMYYSASSVIKAGDRIRPLTGPVHGTFEVRAVPDPAIDMDSAHHMEVQVVETVHSNLDPFPGSTVEELL